MVCCAVAISNVCAIVCLKSDLNIDFLNPTLDVSLKFNSLCFNYALFYSSDHSYNFKFDLVYKYHIFCFTCHLSCILQLCCFCKYDILLDRVVFQCRFLYTICGYLIQYVICRFIVWYLMFVYTYHQQFTKFYTINLQLYANFLYIAFVNCIL